MKVKQRKNFGGMEAILGVTNEQTDKSTQSQRKLKHVMVQQLIPGKYQPRRAFDLTTLRELSDSIAQQGILQPIMVRNSGADTFEIIAGERRWRAAQMAGLQQVPVITCDISDESALAYALIENIQRQELNPIEEAAALKRLIEDFNMTHEQVAKSIGRSRAVVSNMLRLLNLTGSVQNLLVGNKLDVGHAKLLLTLEPDEQVEIASIIIERRLTVRAAESLIRTKKGKIEGAQSKSTRYHQNCDAWGRALSSRFPSKVDVRVNESGSGRIVIHIDSTTEIDWLIEQLNVE